MVIADVKGGDKLKTALQRISRLGYGMKVGFFKGAKYGDGTHVAFVAYLNEFGAGNNPPRPFLRRTGKLNALKWAQGIARQIKMRGGATDANVKAAFEAAGLVAQGDVKRVIAEWPANDPRPNDAKTIAAKARRGRSGRNLEAVDPTRVLIDTGKMISSVAYKVEKKG